MTIIDAEQNWEPASLYEQRIHFHHDYINGSERVGIVGATIEDVLYGEFEFDAAEPGDAAIIGIIQSEAFQRLALIEQLILPAEFTTRPETAGFTRYEHSIGSMLLTRRLGSDHKQQLRALIHDISQTAFSHLGDWREQGMGGAEDFHDQIKLEYARKHGLDKLLQGYGFVLEELLDDSIVDFVERPAPDLCVDRVDYSLREFARWTCPDLVEDFIDKMRVKDDMIVFESSDAARHFAYYYRELFVWHWAYDKQAAKEKLLLTAIQYAIDNGILDAEDMYSVDRALLTKMQLAEDSVLDALYHILGQDLNNMTHQIGSEEALNYPESRMPGVPDKICYLHRDFKSRWVDPSFIDAEARQRIQLSFVDADHRRTAEFHADMQKYTFSSKYDEFGQEQLHYVEINVDPEVKRALSGVGDIL